MIRQQEHGAAVDAARKTHADGLSIVGTIDGPQPFRDLAGQRADIALSDRVEIRRQAGSPRSEEAGVDRIGIGTADERELDQVVGRHHPRVSRMELPVETGVLQRAVQGIDSIGHEERRPLVPLGQKVAHRAIEGARHADREPIDRHERKRSVDRAHRLGVAAHHAATGLREVEVVELIQARLEQINDAIDRTLHQGIVEYGSRPRRASTAPPQHLDPEGADRHERKQIDGDHAWGRPQVVGCVHLALHLGATEGSGDRCTNGKRAFMVHQERDELAADEPVHRNRLATAFRSRAIDGMNVHAGCRPLRNRRPGVGRVDDNPEPPGRPAIVGRIRIGPDGNRIRAGHAVGQNRKRRTAVRLDHTAIDEKAHQRHDDNREGPPNHPPSPVPLISIGCERIQSASIASPITMTAHGAAAGRADSG